MVCCLLLLHHVNGVISLGGRIEKVYFICVRLMMRMLGFFFLCSLIASGFTKVGMTRTFVCSDIRRTCMPS